jgi:hypothetical protein
MHMTEDKPPTPAATGRKWFYWAAAVVAVATIARYATKFDVNAVAVLVLNLVVFGSLAFFAGWLYGKSKRRS